MANKKTTKRRILLKLSGEALSKDGHRGVSATALKSIAEEIAQMYKSTGCQLAIVIGGGNIWRGVRDGGGVIDRVNSDGMGKIDDNMPTETTSQTRTLSFSSKIVDLKNTRLVLTFSTDNIQNIIYFKNIKVDYQCYK